MSAKRRRMRVALFPGDLCKLLYDREPLVVKKASDGNWVPARVSGAQLSSDRRDWQYALVNDKNVALFIEPSKQENFGIFLIDETFVKLRFRDVAIISLGSL